VPIDPEFALKIEESMEEWGKLLQVLDFFNGMLIYTDMDSYLSEDTLSWCQEQLSSRA
jgi:hypothetical protein